MKKITIVSLALVIMFQGLVSVSAAVPATVPVIVKVSKGYDLAKLRAGMEIPIRTSEIVKSQDQVFLKKGAKGHLRLATNQTTGQLMIESGFVTDSNGKQHRIFFNDGIKSQGHNLSKTAGLTMIGGSAVAVSTGAVMMAGASGAGMAAAVVPLIAVPLIGVGALVGLGGAAMASHGKKKPRIKRNQEFAVQVAI